MRKMEPVLLFGQFWCWFNVLCSLLEVYLWEVLSFESSYRLLEEETRVVELCRRLKVWLKYWFISKYTYLFTFQISAYMDGTLLVEQYIWTFGTKCKIDSSLICFIQVWTVLMVQTVVMWGSCVYSAYPYWYCTTLTTCYCCTTCNYFPVIVLELFYECRAWNRSIEEY